MNPKEKDLVVSALADALHSGEQNLKTVPQLIIRVIEEDVWRERVRISTGEVVTFKSFEEFVSSEPPAGLGADLRTIKNLCRDEARALDAINSATVHHGGKHDNIMVEANQGTSKDYALRKLRKDAPELHQKVLDGELSAHAAMIQAGFRKQKTPLEWLTYWWSKADESQRQEFLNGVG